jgi:hypothetical protein
MDREVETHIARGRASGVLSRLRASGTVMAGVCMLARAILIVGVVGLLSLPLSAVQADANEEPKPHPKGSAAEIGQKLSNPASDVWALYTEFDFSFLGGTATGGSGDRTAQAMIFQPIMPIKLTKRFKLLTRPTLPVIMNQDVPQSTSSPSSFNNFGGLGDLSLPLLLSQEAPLFKMGGGGIVGAAGPAFNFPTSTNDAFGSQQYEVGFAALALFKNRKITVGLFPEWWWGVGWRSSSKPNNGMDPNANHGELLYFFYYELGNAWQIGINPTIAYNHEAPSKSRWNVPVGVTVAKTWKFGKMPIKFLLSGEYSVVNEDLYGKRWLIKVNVIPVIPDLIRKPLFGS